jgi:DNA polymerase-1
MPGKQKLVLVDGSAVAYRSYFAFIRRPLRNSRGENTSAAFGFTRALAAVLSEHEPDYVCVVFDTPAPTYRHEIYEEYKSTRPEMPEDLQLQLPWIKDIIRAMGVTTLEMEGFEADDLMAALAKEARESGIETLILTSDKDMYQLVDDRVRICDPKTGDVLGAQEVERKFGVPPGKVVDVLSLSGDRSDNIPGIDGIGPKTAVSLIDEFGSLEEVYANIDKVSGKKRRESLLKNKKLAELSRDLATLDENVDTGVELEDLKPKDRHSEELSRIFSELDFTSLLEEFGRGQGELHCSCRIISGMDELREVRRIMISAGSISVQGDFEGQCSVTARLTGVAISAGDDQCYYLPLGTGDERDLESEEAIEVLAELFGSDAVRVSGHDLKTLSLCFANERIYMSKLHVDSMIASYLIDPSGGGYRLKDVAAEYLGYRKAAKSGEPSEPKLDVIAAEACERAAIVCKLSKLLPEKLEELELVELFEKIEMPLIPVLAKMEQNGVAVDVSMLTDLSQDFEKRLDSIQEEIFSLAGERFNIGSTKQLGNVLFNKLGLKPGRRTATGYSTAEDVLQKLAPTHPLPHLVLEHRQLSKLKSTYVDSLRALINPETNRIHTSFNQAVTATGRLSSTNPNLQNIPMRTEEGRKIRKAFVAGSENWMILSADYSQIELRLLAHLSGDQGLQNAFSKGRDIHSSTAAALMGVEEEGVTPELRSRAKEVNFGIIYGMGSHGLASRLGIDHDEAKNFIKGYFEAYPGVRQFIDRTIEDARRQGFVTTILNRRRYLPGMHSDSKAAVRLSERMAVNTRIQGSAADLIKIAMIEVDREIRRLRLQAKMIIQVHDELVFEVSREDLDELEGMVAREMASAAGLEFDVPIVVNTASGSSWFEAHA